jgi:hypothetical protein
MALQGSSLAGCAFKKPINKNRQVAERRIFFIKV